MNVNIKTHVGVSDKSHSIREEIEKANILIKAKTDILADVSTINIEEMRKELSQFKNQVRLFSVPCYDILNNDPITIIERDIKYGVSGMTIHLTPRELFEKQSVYNSRASFFFKKYYEGNTKENPLLEHFDSIQTMCRQANVQIYIGNALRSGHCKDYDNYLFKEDLKFSSLKMTDNSVLEIGGHIPFEHIADYAQFIHSINGKRKVCLMGPLTTDICSGFDHVVATVGFQEFYRVHPYVETLLNTTCAEHVTSPTLEDDLVSLKCYQVVLTAMNLKNADKVETINKTNKFKCHRSFNIFGEIPRSTGNCRMCGDFCPLEDQTN